MKLSFYAAALLMIGNNAVKLGELDSLTSTSEPGEWLSETETDLDDSYTNPAAAFEDSGDLDCFAQSEVDAEGVAESDCDC